MSTCRKSKNCPSGYKCKGNLFGLKKGRCSPKRVKSKKTTQSKPKKPLFGSLFKSKPKSSITKPKSSGITPGKKYYKSPKFWFYIVFIILILVTIGLICWWFFNTVSPKKFCGGEQCDPSFPCCPEDGNDPNAVCLDPSKEVCCNNVKYDKNLGPWGRCGGEFCCSARKDGKKTCCHEETCCHDGQECCDNGPKCCQPGKCCGAGSSIQCCEGDDVVCCGENSCCHKEHCVDPNTNKPVDNYSDGICCEKDKLCKTDPNKPEECCPGDEICMGNKCVASCTTDNSDKKLYCDPSKNEVCAKIEGLTKPANLSPSSIWIPNNNDNRGTVFFCKNDNTCSFEFDTAKNTSVMNFLKPDDEKDGVQLAFPTNDIDPTGDGVGFCGYDITKGAVTSQNVQVCGVADTESACNQIQNCEWLEVSKIIDGATDEENKKYIFNIVDQLEKRYPDIGKGYYASGDQTPPIAVVRYTMGSPPSDCSFNQCFTELNHWGITNIFYNAETGACAAIYDAGKNADKNTRVTDGSNNPGYNKSFYKRLNATTIADCQKTFPDDGGAIQGSCLKGTNYHCMSDGTLRCKGHCDISNFSDCKSAIAGGCNFCYPCVNGNCGIIPASPSSPATASSITTNGYTLGPGQDCPGQLIEKGDEGLCDTMMGMDSPTTPCKEGANLYSNSTCYDLTENQAKKYTKMYTGGSTTNVGGLGGIPPVAGSSCQTGRGYGCYNDCDDPSSCDKDPKGAAGVCYDNDQINMYIINRTPYTFNFNSGTSDPPCPKGGPMWINGKNKTWQWWWTADEGTYAWSCQYAEKSPDTTDPGGGGSAAFNFFPSDSNNNPNGTCAKGGWGGDTPNWTIYPWTSGWGYARQNHDSLLPGDTDKLEGLIILQDQEDPKNQIQLHFYLTEKPGGSKDVNDNRKCGSSIQYSQTKVNPGGDWQYKGQPACVKVSTICRDSFYGSTDLAGLLVYTIDIVPPNSNGTCD